LKTASKSMSLTNFTNASQEMGLRLRSRLEAGTEQRR
jgi:hypothetical protein